MLGPAGRAHYARSGRFTPFYCCRVGLPMVGKRIYPDHREGRGEASKKVREHPLSAQEARPAGQMR